ncbi:MAG: imidazole glycerol phosphate synthase subunit HisH [Deltaproteobacteria bacterium]|nr:imidazole glycerol phosphate synthase subunit HisH [Deltaproteobacteria bacterium]
MLAIIDYKAGNLTSVKRALAHLDILCAITDKPETILSAERVIFPGVGAAGKAMEVINSHGLFHVIHEVVSRGTPFLGICLGTQIILERSEEDTATCLGIISGMARRFAGGEIKIPHMGWNTLSVRRPHSILKGIDPRTQFYFVHSYYPVPLNQEDIIATTDYNVSFASIIGHQNVVATQFHPEKSGQVGLRLLKNFCEWDGVL